MTKSASSAETITGWALTRRKAETSLQCSIISTFKIIQRHQNKHNFMSFSEGQKYTKYNLAGTPRFVQNILKIITSDLQNKLDKHLEIKL